MFFPWWLNLKRTEGLRVKNENHVHTPVFPDRSIWPGLPRHLKISIMRRCSKLALVLLLILCAGYLLMRFSGFDPLWPLFPAWSQSLQSGNLKSSLDSSLAHHRPYVIESVTVLIDIEDLPEQKPLQRRTSFRYVYTIRPLHKIAADDKSFTESLHNHFGKNLEYFQGSNPQQALSLKTNEVTFNVSLDADKGDVYTIVTGMRILEDMPLKERSLRGFHFAPNEYVAVYPNDEDYIGQVTLLLTSATTHLKVANDAAWRKADSEANPQFSPAQLSQSASESYATTLCVRFSNVKPGEIVGLKYYW
jgi:hypothetical protein